MIMTGIFVSCASWHG